MLFFVMRSLRGKKNTQLSPLRFFRCIRWVYLISTILVDFHSIFNKSWIRSLRNHKKLTKTVLYNGLKKLLTGLKQNKVSLWEIVISSLSYKNCSWKVMEHWDNKSASGTRLAGLTRTRSRCEDLQKTIFNQDNGKLSRWNVILANAM